jgi:hypothetical protein
MLEQPCTLAERSPIAAFPRDIENYSTGFALPWPSPAPDRDEAGISHSRVAADVGGGQPVNALRAVPWLARQRPNGSSSPIEYNPVALAEAEGELPGGGPVRGGPHDPRPSG